MEVEWRAHGAQIQRIKVDTKKNQQEVLSTTNHIKEAILKNNWIFTEKWESTQAWIDRHADVEQAVVYSTLPQEYSTLTFRGEVVAGGGGVEERGEVMYCIEVRTYIYYKCITCHSCIV